MIFLMVPKVEQVYSTALEGFTVSSVHNGDVAVEEFQTKKYDLMVLDIMLPGRQGLDVLLYVSLARQLIPLQCRMEANYMLEDNRSILNALDKMGMTEIKKYRVYEKDL